MSLNSHIVDVDKLCLLTATLLIFWRFTNRYFRRDGDQYLLLRFLKIIEQWVQNWLEYCNVYLFL